MTEDICPRFEREGYIVVKDTIGQNEIQALRSYFLPLFHAKKTNVLPDAVLHYPDILKVLRNPKLVHALTTLLGETFVVPPNSSIEFNRYGVFHTDTTGAEINDQTFHKEKEFRMVTVAIYLQDNTEYGGGIRLVPGSHKRPDPYVELTKRKAEVRRNVSQSPLQQLLRRLSRGELYDWDKPFREHEHAIDIPAKAGDAIIWDMRLVHRASPKRAKGPAPEGGKLSIFFNCGSNNWVTTDAYMKYVTSIAENEYLRSQHRITALAGLGAQNEFVLL